ncbi:MAG TPA: TIGR01777 family oxidoreductase [candidate division Zixibacteria bacterium]|jgi:uncharacterized protein (TIGR01777 family)
MKIIITGATGFIGKALSNHLVEAGHEVIALSRSAKKASEIFGQGITVAEWDGKTAKGWAAQAEGAYAIINLAGENIGVGRWTREKKQSILESRLNAGKAAVEAVKLAKEKPKVMIQASAIGYYNSHSEEILDESSPPGKGFLPEVAQSWEASTEEVESSGVRHIIIRTGIVLGKGGGAFPRLLLPFRLFVGGPLGSGNQWFSWIHLQDEVRTIRFLMEKEDLQGVFNLTSPGHLRQKEFSKILGKVMKRPSWLPVPGLMLRLLMGEMADELLLSGQRVIPKRLLQAEYRFQHPEVESALREILSEEGD